MFGGNRTGFGATTAQPFGSNTSSFGNQQPTNNAFGMNQQNAGQQSLGGFGMNNNNANNTGSAGGMFGANNNNMTGGSGMFGQNNGNNNNALVRTGTGMFGNAAGNTMSNPLMGNSMATAGQGAGTGIKPFTAFQEKDPTTSTINVFQSISCMPEYRNYSFEELRFQDYQAGRKNSSAQVPASGGMNSFGQANATNGMNNTNSGGLFGNNNNTVGGASSGGLFGQRQTTGFGASTGNNSMFGGNTANNTNSMNSPFGMKTQGTTGMFGQQSNTNAFGQQQTGANAFGQQQNTNAFGMNNNNNTAQNSAGGLFGQSNNNNSFGQQNNNQSGGLFGQNNTQQGGMFGQKPATGGLFGQASNTNAFGANANSNTSTGGLFGQNNNTNNQATTGMFGQTNNTNSMFGNNTNNANTGFGAQQNNNSMFGQNQNSGGLFGQNKPASGGLFGQNNANTQQQGGLCGQNKPATGGLFGQNNSQPQQGGLFGQNNNQQQQGGLFGQNNQQQQQGGLFGQNNNQQQQQSGGLFGNKPASGGLFGQSNTQQNTTSGGLFGQNNQTQQSGGLFGAKPAGATGGLFGNNTQQQQPAAGGLFGAKPAGTTGGLFGNNTQQQQQPAAGGLFGNNNNTAGQSTLGGNSSGGLFGAKPAGTGLFNSNSTSTTGGLFGAKPQTTSSALGGGVFGNSNATTTGGGLFGSNAQQTGSAFGGQTQLGGGLTAAQQTAGQQPGLVQNNPFGTNSLFHQISSNQTTFGGATEINITKVNADTKKNTTLNNAYKLVPKPLFSAQGQLEAIDQNSSRKMIPSKALSLTRESLLENRDVQNSLIHLAETLFATRENEENSQLNSNMLFNPQKTTFKDAVLKRQSEIKTIETTQSIPSKETTEVDNKLAKETKKNTLPPKETAIVPVEPEKTTGDVTPTEGVVAISTRPAGLHTDDFSLVGEDYYISPSLETLSSMSLLELRKVDNLIVGNINYGKIEFLAPVDLSTTPAALICEKFIRFSPEKCYVLANSEENADYGAGMNVAARITLLNCFPINRQNRQPITDPDHPLVKRHIEKLRRKPNTRFEKYDSKTGSYVFTVDNPIV